MKYFLSIFFCLTFSAVAVGQNDSNLDYDALIAQILEDIPLENFKNEPTFLRVSFGRGFCIVDENDNNNGYQTKNTIARTHFLSVKNIALLQRKIRTSLIPYFEFQGMESGIFFHGNPALKGYPDLMPKFKTITRGKIQYHNTKLAFGYFPYKNKPVKINIQKESLQNYIKQTNHVQLEFSQTHDHRVFVFGTINNKKVSLSYQSIHGTWQQIP